MTTDIQTVNCLRLHTFSSILIDMFASSPDDSVRLCNVLVKIRRNSLFVPIATRVRPVTLRGSLLHGGSGVAPRGRSNPSCRVHGVQIQPSSLQNGTPVSSNILQNLILETWEDVGSMRKNCGQHRAEGRASV